jgi:hypothetical protein
VLTDCEGQSIMEANVVRFSVLQGEQCTRYVAVPCGLEFVVGDCHGQSLLDSRAVLSWSTE